MKLTLTRAIAAATVALSLTAVHAQDKPRVEMKTSLGNIVIELDAAAAPKSVANFLEYTKAGFYEGTVFHRVIKGFMAQGGGFDKTLKQKKRAPRSKTKAKLRKKAGLKNDRGTIAMARTGDPHSATAQFYINYKDNAMLNASQAKNNVPPPCKAENAPPQCKQFGWGYTAFGRVVQGMEIVEQNGGVRTGAVGMFPTDGAANANRDQKVTLVTKK